MIRVIIAEDEPAIARGLATLISQEDSEFEVVSICKNGKEGVRRILSLAPDLVFLDIHMPGLSGIEMMEKIRAADEPSLADTSFVILTGYADFEYAKKAISLEIQEYLLKPLSLEALRPILRKVRQRKGAGLPQKRADAIRNLLRKGQQARKSDPALSDLRCALFVVFVGPLCGNFVSGVSAPIPCVQPTDELIAKLREHYGLTLVALESHHRNEYLYVLLGEGDATKEEDIRAAAKEVYRAFRAEGSCVNAWLSAPLHDANRLPEVLRDVYLEASLSTRYDQSAFYDARHLPETAVSVSREISRLAACFGGAMREETLAGLTHTAVSFWKKAQVTQWQLVIDLRYLISVLMRDHLEEEIFYPDASAIAVRAATYDNLELLLLEMFRDLCGIADDAMAQSSSRRLAEKVREWLDRNYAKQIVFSDFREIFGYSEKYIASLFKEKYDIAPSKYLGRLRIDAAKRLMRENPRLLLKDVAESVGYADEFYFSRVFKNSEGVSPGQFMQQAEKS